MKSYLLLLVASICSTSFFAQQGFRFKNAAEHNVRISQLDSTYQSAINADSTKAVFKDQEAFANAYRQMLIDFGGFLAKNGFEWEENTMGFNRVYFHANGKIDYFIYQLRSPYMTEEKTAAFEQLLNQFIQTYTLPMTAPVNFAQCSPVTYTPKKEEN